MNIIIGERWRPPVLFLLSFPFCFLTPILHTHFNNINYLPQRTPRYRFRLGSKPWMATEFNDGPPRRSRIFGWTLHSYKLLTPGVPRLPAQIGDLDHGWDELIIDGSLPRSRIFYWTFHPYKLLTPWATRVQTWINGRIQVVFRNIFGHIGCSPAITHIAYTSMARAFTRTKTKNCLGPQVSLLNSDRRARRNWF